MAYGESDITRLARESPAKPPETLPLTIRWGSFKSTLDPEIQPSSTRILKSTISAIPRPNRQNQSPHTLRLYPHERTKCCDSPLQKHALFLFSGRMVLKPGIPKFHSPLQQGRAHTCYVQVLIFSIVGTNVENWHIFSIDECSALAFSKENQGWWYFTLNPTASTLTSESSLLGCQRRSPH